MNYKPEPTNIPYLFLPLTEKEEDQLSTMQDFMQKYRKDLPIMTVKAMLHHIAIQMQNVIDIWQKDIVKQVEQNDKSQEGPITEQQKEHMANMLLAQTVAFLLANKAYISSSKDILKQAAILLSLLYPPLDEEAK